MSPYLMWTLILMLQATPNLGEIARRQREQQKTPKSSTTITNDSARDGTNGTATITTSTTSTSYRPAGPGMSEFVNREIGIRLTVPSWWQSRVNIAASSVEFKCIETEYDGCRLTVASEVAPKNLTSITDVKRKQWAFHFADKDQVTARDFSVGGLPAFESKGVEPRGREIRYIHVLARDFLRIYVFTFSAEGKQREEYARVFDQVLQSFSPVRTSGYAGRDEEPLRFLEEEQEGYKTMVGLFLLSLTCVSDASTKLCSVAELVQNPPVIVDAKWIQALTSNPDYTFSISGTTDKFELAAIPKRPGLGGFFQDDGGVHYNPRGPASKSDPLVRGNLPH